jgi:hypothetical protein
LWCREDWHEFTDVLEVLRAMIALMTEAVKASETLAK